MCSVLNEAPEDVNARGMRVMRECVRACVRECVRECMRACMRACVRACSSPILCIAFVTFDVRSRFVVL